MIYPIHEMFHSFQGEGVHMGREAFFVRLYGCPVHCPWCDSAGTWHPKWVPDHIKKMTPAEIVAEFRKSIPKPGKWPGMVVITGGEPAIFNLAPMLRAFGDLGVDIHLETSGGFKIQDDHSLNWVTVSPKRWKTPLPAALARANEFKIIVEKPEDIDFYAKYHQGTEAPVWLHPEWGSRHDRKVIQAICAAVKSGKGYRAGYQIHKLFFVDHLDPRTQPPVPLGGEGSTF